MVVVERERKFPSGSSYMERSRLSGKGKFEYKVYDHEKRALTRVMD